MPQMNGAVLCRAPGHGISEPNGHQDTIFLSFYNWDTNTERRKVTCPRPQISGDGAESRTLVSLTLVQCSLYYITIHGVENNGFCFCKVAKLSGLMTQVFHPTHTLTSNTSWAPRYHRKSKEVT